ncbi:pyridine nucleotide-disulfide oxidoreductase [Brevirhabdus pacifica]|uniref:Pyridine nucleotide-disulfide oxidoreductase n=1 Tax=Brevirhabdus pacifica TaxID=1267768 RepID=A0A1U7DJB1_9RHOB|nr:FAD-dependent oxidoreductase [Brevirhabdus pacifica]APX90061.1 pyridine nucleotide-disulfide oxidoreductase [Brevirhabdus pacifica]OWU75347.1 pyridine nucleotide-disulfide oxidoreductase [Loktanella sp. 22II-4b]PJJ82687.1 3-phenylpropionate/trans-cinnamate dioxygenase ferredoxin reductase subunit [Brevirhabdus pacifica]
MTHFVVVGAGQAGASLVARLRAKGFEGRITLVGDEDAPPYQRPPLSKGYLLGEISRERLFLRPERFYGEQKIDLLTGRKVTAIDTSVRSLTLAGPDGAEESLSYDALALTTGSRPRHLPAAIGGALKGVHVVRTLADVDAMAPEFAEGRRALIVGGGYIGLEAAAVACKLGVAVTVVEMGERILQRVAAPETSERFRQLHAAHGVDLREGVGLERLTEGEADAGDGRGDGRVHAAQLTDGSTLEVDFVIVGVGILPETELAEAAGLAVEDGIRVDALGRSSAPDVWAAGDCANFPLGEGRLRLESVQNAIDQAEAVADNMMGAETPYVPRPWFWSDQYDAKLQIAGLNTGYDRVVVRAAPEAAEDLSAPVSYWYFRGDTLLAVDAINDPRSYMVGKRLIEAGRSPEPAQVARHDLPVKELLG